MTKWQMHNDEDVHLPFFVNYRNAKTKVFNKVGFGGSVYLSAFQKVTVLGEVKGTDWFYVKFRCFHHTDGKFYMEKGFVKKKYLKSKLTAFEKDLVNQDKALGYEHPEDTQFNNTLYLD